MKVQIDLILHNKASLINMKNILLLWQNDFGSWCEYAKMNLTQNLVLAGYFNSQNLGLYNINHRGVHKIPSLKQRHLEAWGAQAV